MRAEADRSRLQPRSGAVRVGRGLPPSGRSTCSIDTTFGRADVRCLATGRSLGKRSRKIPGFASPPFDGFAEFADRTLRQPMWLPSSAGNDVGPVRRRPIGRRSRSLRRPEPVCARGARDRTVSRSRRRAPGADRQRRVEARVAVQDAAVGKQGRDRGRLERPGEIEALRELAAQRPQAAELRPLLHALRDDRQPQRPPERHDRAGELPRIRVERIDIDEVPGDLERRHRELLEVAQRRVAGAEVVDRDADPGIPELLQLRPGRGDVLEHRRFGHLEHDPGRLHPGRPDDRQDLVDEVGLGQLSGRDVDAHGERPVGR